MQNNHFIHDLFIVIGISLLSTISIAISIFSRYGFFYPPAFKPVWISFGITLFFVLLVLLFIRDVRSKWIMLIKRAMSINTRRLLYEKGYFSFLSFFLCYYSFLSCHQYTLLILNCLLSHLPSTLSFITQKEIDSMCLFIKA